MKIEINVLPDGQKEKLREDRKTGIVLKVFFSLIAVLLLVNAVLYAMSVVLSVELQAEKKSGENVMQKKSEKEGQLENIFKNTSVQMATIQRTKAVIPGWARVLARIAELSSGGISVSQITAEGTQLKMSGFAKTREDLLDLQDKLKLEGMQFPVDISNLVASKDFNFELDLNIPQDYLIRK
jgi:hypothetical protein